MNAAAVTVQSCHCTHRIHGTYGRSKQIQPDSAVTSAAPIGTVTRRKPSSDTDVVRRAVAIARRMRSLAAIHLPPRHLPIHEAAERPMLQSTKAPKAISSTYQTTLSSAK